MRYLVKQKILSVGDSFTIKDENQVDKYVVKGKVISVGGKLKFCDMAGNELLRIEQKLLKLLPEYHIYYNGQDVATVKKAFTFLTAKFNIQSTKGNYTIDGNFFKWDYKINRDGKPAAIVSKKVVALSDSYSIDITEGEDDVFMLALVIIIDQVLHKK